MYIQNNIILSPEKFQRHYCYHKKLNKITSFDAHFLILIIEHQLFDGSMLSQFFVCFLENGIKKCPIICQEVVIIFLTYDFTILIATPQPPRNSLSFSFLCLQLKNQFSDPCFSLLNIIAISIYSDKNTVGSEPP